MPAGIKAGSTTSLSLFLADDPARAKEIRLELVWQEQGAFEPPTISINGHACAGLKLERVQTNIVLSSSAPGLAKALKCGANEFTFKARSATTLTSLSVHIVP